MNRRKNGQRIAPRSGGAIRLCFLRGWLTNVLPLKSALSNLEISAHLNVTPKHCWTNQAVTPPIPNVDVALGTTQVQRNRIFTTLGNDGG